MTSCGLPFFLEDQTGELTGSEFVDLYNRMRLSLRCTLRDAAHTAYMVYDTSARPHALGAPLACLDFAANHALGTVKIGARDAVPMGEYLVKAGALGGQKSRKFRAADGQEYRWTHQRKGDEEWSCTNASDYHVASYCLKSPDEPKYAGSSGCVLTVEESYSNIVGELLASLIIMRHIAKYNL
ncbi:hypothetical protein DAEQUDRAFT_723694 [Daedalea quercina L-15889]|uniref:DUF6593 domain-containing protein n=1 Tax=Daedalea quercina L-15889 TaxID=1314783 RepID=A0A165S7N5_9APHY|nr:hypothetical protein DAEQUDRAFT_723694 [Daedalea quercina L-15889]